MSDDNKRGVGQPPIIKSPQEMEDKINEYFKSLLPQPLLDNNGNVLKTKSGELAFSKERKPSVVGMALYLGYESRQSFYDNIKKPEYSYILKRARSKVELGVLDGGMDDEIPQALTIFLLKQFGYSDKPREEEKDNFRKDKSILSALLGGDSDSEA